MLHNSELANHSWPMSKFKQLCNFQLLRGRCFSSTAKKKLAPTEEKHPGGPAQSMPRIMHPDWYRTPMAEDDPRMIGDYPDVPAQSYQHKSPYVTYDYPELKRNHGDPVPEDYESLTEWSFDHEKDFGVKYVLGGVFGLFGSFYLIYKCTSAINNPLTPFAAPRTLPYIKEYYPDGKKVPDHYTKTNYDMF